MLKLKLNCCCRSQTCNVLPASLRLVDHYTRSAGVCFRLICVIEAAARSEILFLGYVY